MMKPQAGRPHRHKRTITSLSPHRLNTNTQADSRTGNTQNISSQPHRRNTTILPPHGRNTKKYKLAATQATKLRACCHTANKTASFQPHRQPKYKLAATQASYKTTSSRPHRQQNYKLTATQAEKNYKLAATQASYKTTSLPPHKRQNYQLTATQAYGIETVYMLPQEQN